MKPNLLLLGAQKSSSTFLGAWLAKHPQIHVRTREDTSFEDPEYASFDPDSLEEDLPDSIRYFAIRRPSYLAVPEYTRRLARHCPESRVISVLREPVARAISAYHHYVRYGLIPPRNPDRAFARLLAGEAPDGNPNYRRILEFGRYHEQCRRAMELFGADRVLVLLQEDVVGAGAEATFGRALDFLGVDRLPVPPPERRPQASVYDLRRLRLLYLRSRLVYRYSDDGLRGFPIPRDERPWYVRGADRIIKLLDRALLERLRSRRVPEVSKETSERLRAYYADDVQALGELLGCNLGQWAYEGTDSARGTARSGHES